MGKCRTLLRLMAAAVMLLVVAGCSGAKQQLTIMSVSSGSVSVTRPGTADAIVGAVGTELKAGDVIQASDGSGAVITFFEGSTIEVRAGARLEIKSLEKGPSGTTTILLKQQVGDTFSRVKKLVDASSRYEIETPVAVAAVRGSVMEVNVAADGKTVVTNWEGKISAIAQGVEVPIPPGMQSTVTPGQPPTSPAIRTFSARDDYSVANGNPNGAWTYGWMPVDFSVFNIYATHTDIQWYGPIGSDRTPCIWVNNGGAAYGVPSGWLSLHPGPGTEPSVLRWMAPMAGNVHVVGEFLAGDGGVMTVAVRVNGREVWSARDAGKFDQAVKAAAGDTVDFAVYGGYGFGNTPITVTINYTD